MTMETLLKNKKRNDMKSLIAVACLLIMVILANMANTKIKKKDEEIADKQRIIDSLNQEVFIINSNLNRYEIALDILSEQDKESADSFNQILSNETE